MTSKPYNLVARILHLAIAILIFWAIGLGLVAEDMPNSPDKIELFVLHKSTGFAVLVVAVVRLFWCLMHPSASLELSPLQEKMASAGHLGVVFTYVGCTGKWLASQFHRRLSVCLVLFNFNSTYPRFGGRKPGAVFFTACIPILCNRAYGGRSCRNASGS